MLLHCSIKHNILSRFCSSWIISQRSRMPTECCMCVWTLVCFTVMLLVLNAPMHHKEEVVRADAQRIPAPNSNCMFYAVAIDSTFGLWQARESTIVVNIGLSRFSFKSATHRFRRETTITSDAKEKQKSRSSNTKHNTQCTH